MDKKEIERKLALDDFSFRLETIREFVTDTQDDVVVKLVNELLGYIDNLRLQTEWTPFSIVPPSNRLLVTIRKKSGGALLELTKINPALYAAPGWPFDFTHWLLLPPLPKTYDYPPPPFAVGPNNPKMDKPWRNDERYLPPRY